MRESLGARELRRPLRLRTHVGVMRAAGHVPKMHHRTAMPAAAHGHKMHHRTAMPDRVSRLDAKSCIQGYAPSCIALRIVLP